MKRKSRLILQLALLLISIVLSYYFYDKIAFWSVVAMLGFMQISMLSHVINKFIDKEGSVMLSFFSGMIFRLFFVLILVVWFLALRNITDLWFLVVIFSIYFSDILFELKYIIHNLRAN